MLRFVDYLVPKPAITVSFSKTNAINSNVFHSGKSADANGILVSLNPPYMTLNY